jgi:endo-1,4-beta-xylanase
MTDRRTFCRTALLAAGAVAVPTAALAAAPTLRSLAKKRGLLVGVAVDPRALRDEPAYRDTIAREYDVCVGENAFKFANVHPARDRYTFESADAIAAFARSHGMKLRGHTLVWHNQLAPWVASAGLTRDSAIAVMREHIAAVAGRYRGRVVAWDVVNEAVAEDGSGLRQKSFWHETIGPDFIDMAFRFARDADPTALLYYNDYENEGMDRKSDAVYELVRGLKARGVPIDGVGWQMHVENGFRISDAERTNARRLAALGLQLSVTELDVRTKLPATPESLATQAATYRDIVAFCCEERAFAALLTWGVTDRHSWIPGWYPGLGAALPFDERYAPKPAYAAIRDALAAAPPRGRDGK